MAAIRPNPDDLNTSVAVEGQARRDVAALVADAAREPAMFHLPGVAAAQRYLAQRKFTLAISMTAAARRVAVLRARLEVR